MFKVMHITHNYDDEKMPFVKYYCGNVSWRHLQSNVFIDIE